MGPSEWIALAAAFLGGTALVLGEYRARQARLAASERNIIDWEFSWPERDVLELRNGGPDGAHDVLIKLTSDYVHVEGQRSEMLRGDVLALSVPHLASTWDSAAQRREVPGEYPVVTRVSFGARITWTSPRGRQQETAVTSSVSAPEGGTA